MPGKDGTGPSGQGPIAGGGRGRGKPGRGKMGGNKPGSGPGGICLCPECGKTVEHKRGTPCADITCPNCGTRMIKG